MLKISLVQLSEACWWALVMDQVRNNAVSMVALLNFTVFGISEEISLCY